MDIKFYCNIEGSICNQEYGIHNYSPCCLECPYTCSNCIIYKRSEEFECEYMVTKDELLTQLIAELNKEKFELANSIEVINNKIDSLQKQKHQCEV